MFWIGITHLFKKQDLSPGEVQQEIATVTLLADDFETNEAFAALREQPRFRAAIGRLRAACTQRA